MLFWTPNAYRQWAALTLAETQNEAEKDQTKKL